MPDAYTCEAGQFTVAGWLEPAARMAGDTFDYVLDRDALQLSITNAVGHGLGAAMPATLLVNTLRNSRRAGVPSSTRPSTPTATWPGTARPGEFVTGQLVRIDLAAGSGSIINAGHPAPPQLRDGAVEPLPLLIDVRFGVDRSWR